MSTTARLLLGVSLRDKLSLFWAILFPLGLLLGLGVAFPEPAYQVQLLTGVLAMSTFFSTLWTVAFESVMLRGQGVYKLLRLTPFRTSKFIFSLAAAKSVTALLSSLLVWLVGVVLWQLDVSALSFVLLLPVLITGAMCFLLLGFLVANFAREVTHVSLILNVVGMPLLFASEAFYSLERAPGWFRACSQVLPFQHLVLAVQQALAGNVWATLVHTLVVAGFGVLFLVAATFTWRWRWR